MKSTIPFILVLFISQLQANRLLQQATGCSEPTGYVGPCDAVIPRWTYNSVTGECDAFNYGGCDGNNNNFVTEALCEAGCVPAACTADAQLCPDGSYVGRDPYNNCEFFACPVDVCSLPTGYVGPCEAVIPRWTYNSGSGQCESFDYGGCDGNGNNFETQTDCEQECETPSVCTADAQQCPDGSFVGRDPYNNCEFFACPPIVCTQDAKICPDGTVVGRVGPDCEFAPCAGDVCGVPPTDCGGLRCAANTCPDGDTCWGCCNEECKWQRNGAGDLECAAFVTPESECPVTTTEGPVFCTQDAQQCPDGSFVGRDPDNNCEFFDCPIIPCTRDAKLCPDGTSVGRDGSNNCEFYPCAGDVCGVPPTDCGGLRCPAYTCPDGDTCYGCCNEECKWERIGADLECNSFIKPESECPPVICTLDAMLCPDGSFVGRVAPDCEFAACPPEGDSVFCGGIAGIQCPRSGWECVPDPANTGCVNECGAADCGGVCAKNKEATCGGILGTQCSGDAHCSDNIDDSCNTNCAGADCLGNCYDIMKTVPCGGILGIQCPGDKVCIDDPNDSCDPDCGGADCLGFCAKLNGNTCGGILGTQCTGSNWDCYDAKGDLCSSLCGGADCGGFCAKKIYR